MEVKKDLNLVGDLIHWGVKLWLMTRTIPEVNSIKR